MGANLTSGVSGAAGVREHRKEITFQLWALRNLELELAAAPRMSRSSGPVVEEHARRAMLAAESFFVALADDSGDDRLARS